jgi:hypothetical protein
MHIGYWWESRKEKYQQEEDTNAGGPMILKWTMRDKTGVIWIGLISPRIRTGKGLL